MVIFLAETVTQIESTYSALSLDTKIVWLWLLFVLK